MADRYCPNCGTEVDADARFCPTCGQTLEDEAPPVTAQDHEQPTAAIPVAPAWPSSPPAEQPAAAPAPGPDMPPPAATPQPPPAPQAAVPPQPAAPPPSTTAPPGQPPAGAPAEATDGADLPITLPTTLSGWLIGAGSGLSAIALVPRLGNVLNLVLFLALLAITASIFLADRLPRFGHLRLAKLVVVMVALGVALDRSAFTVRGIDTVFLITALVAAGGVLLVELDRDRPMPPADGPG